MVRLLHAAYAPVLRFAVANQVLTLGAGVLLVLLSLLAGRALQLEFLPKLEEATVDRATMPTAISLEEGNGYVNRMRAVMRSFPESSPWCRSTEGQMTARTRRAFTTPNSTCR